MDYLDDDDFSGMESSSVTSDSEYITPQRLRGGADDENQNADDGNQADPKDDYDWGADMQSVSPSFLAVPEVHFDDITPSIGPLIQLSPYLPEDIFSMKLQSPEGRIYNDEINDLPDPRLYGISV